MLKQEAITCWISSAGQAVLEVKQEQRGTTSYGYVEAQDGQRFAVRCSIPDREHDYSIKVSVDGGSFVISRALPASEETRECAITSIPSTANGSQALPLVFSARSVYQPSGHGDSSSQYQALGKGTIQVTITKCVLEEIENTGAYRTHRTSRSLESNTAAMGDFSHLTRLAAARVEDTRKSYRRTRTESCPAATFVFFYGSLDHLHALLTRNPFEPAVPDLTLNPKIHPATVLKPYKIRAASSAVRTHGRSASDGALKYTRIKAPLTARLSLSLFASLMPNSAKENGRKHIEGRPEASTSSFFRPASRMS